MKRRIKQTAVILLVLTMLLVQTVPAFAASGRWIKSGSRWWYRHADASYTANDWEKIGGKWYHFDKKGWMQTGWLLTGGKWYYLNKNGDMRIGWLKDKGKWYYLDKNGAMVTGWRTLPYRRVSYCRDVNGVLRPSSQEAIDDDGVFHFSNSGVMSTGMEWIDGDLYYFHEIYSFMCTGYSVFTENGDYYFTENGKAAVGWRKNSYYYENRTMAKDTWIDGKYLDLYGYVCPNPGIDFDYEINELYVFYENPLEPSEGMRMSLISENPEDFEPLLSFFLSLKETDKEVKRESDMNYTKPIYKFEFRRYDSTQGRENIFVYPYAGIATCEGVNYEIDMDELREVLNSMDVQ